MKFRFAALQSDIGMQLLKQCGRSNEKINSIVLMENGKIYTRSTAVLRIAKQLKGPVKLIYLFVIIPPFLRDAVYHLIAKKRYRWFGRKDSCMIPGPELMKRFEV
jgi:predicted DCC family thiol-disulfide oxidoreductase YuxK